MYSKGNETIKCIIKRIQLPGYETDEEEFFSHQEDHISKEGVSSQVEESN